MSLAVIAGCSRCATCPAPGTTEAAIARLERARAAADAANATSRAPLTKRIGRSSWASSSPSQRWVPTEHRRRLSARPAGVFVQFTYGLQSPIPRDVCADRYSAVRSRPILRNLPPAFVWTYRLDTRNGDVAKGR